MDFKTFFDTSRAQLRQGKPAQVKLGRVERHRPAGLIHTNTRSPACGGLYWYQKPEFSKNQTIFKKTIENTEDSPVFSQKIDCFLFVFFFLNSVVVSHGGGPFVGVPLI